MPIVSGFVVPKMNPTRHVGNIILLRPVVVTVEHQEDSQAENYESKDKEEPEELCSKKGAKSMENWENCCIFAEDKLHLGKDCKGEQKIRNYD